jgi:hypothetical protein
MGHFVSRGDIVIKTLRSTEIEVKFMSRKVENVEFTISLKRRQMKTLNSEFFMAN